MQICETDFGMMVRNAPQHCLWPTADGTCVVSREKHARYHFFTFSTEAAI